MIAFISLITLFVNADHRVGVIGCAIWFIADLIYFAVRGRHNLVYSPEEDFAVHLGNTSGVDGEGRKLEEQATKV